MSDIKPGTPEFEALSPQKRGAITRKLKQEQNMADAQVEQGEATQETVTMTMEQVQQMMRNVAEQVRAEVSAELKGSAPVEPKRKLSNTDFIKTGVGEVGQSQESVAQIANSVGPVSRGANFIPAVPEHVQARDLDEQRGVINKLQGFGYRVTLDRVDFGVVFEPTDDEGVVVKGVKEPEEAKPYIDALLNADARNSRIWLQAWFNNRTLTGERQIDEAAAREGSAVSVMSQLEVGNFSGIDNVAELSAV